MESDEYRIYWDMVWSYYRAARDFKIINRIPSRDMRSMVDRTYNGKL